MQERLMPAPKLTYYNLSVDKIPIPVESEDDLHATADWLVDQTIIPGRYKIHTGFLGYDGDKSPWIHGQKRPPQCFRTRVVRLDIEGRETEDETLLHNATYDDAVLQHKYAVQWCKKMVENEIAKGK
jgi:hypothetical protein